MGRETRQNQETKPLETRPEENAEARLLWADLMRALAAAAVVVLHTSAYSVVSKTKLPPAEWWVANFADASVRWAVPCFVMLSGALLLDPRRNESMSEFYRRRFQRVFLPIFFWTAIYLAVPGWRGSPLALQEIVVKVLRGQPSFHLWYVFMIPGLYLFMPLLRRFVATATQVERRAAIVLTLAVGSAHMLLTSTRYVNTTGTVFSTFVPYLGFLLCGHELVRHGGWRWPRRSLWASLLACIAMVAFTAHLTTDRWGPFSGTRAAYHPLSPMVILLSILVFETVRGISVKRLVPLRGALVHLGAMSFGIYLVHPLWMIAWADLTGGPTENSFSETLFLQPVAVFVASYVSVLVLSRLPLLRRVVV